MASQSSVCTLGGTIWNNQLLFSRLVQKNKAATQSAALQEPRIIRYTLTCIALAFLAFFIVLPLVSIFITAFQKGRRLLCCDYTSRCISCY